MADKIIENNQVSVMGRIATGFTFSHQVFGEGFYMMDILVKRLSDSEDRIILKSTDSSGPITVMRKREIDLCFRYLPGK